MRDPVASESGTPLSPWIVTFLAAEAVSAIGSMATMVVVWGYAAYEYDARRARYRCTASRSPSPACSWARNGHGRRPARAEADADAAKVIGSGLAGLLSADDFGPGGARRPPRRRDGVGPPRPPVDAASPGRPSRPRPHQRPGVADRRVAIVPVPRGRHRHRPVGFRVRSSSTPSRTASAWRAAVRQTSPRRGIPARSPRGRPLGGPRGLPAIVVNRTPAGRRLHRAVFFLYGTGPPRRTSVRPRHPANGRRRSSPPSRRRSASPRRRGAARRPPRGTLASFGSVARGAGVSGLTAICTSARRTSAWRSSAWRRGDSPTPPSRGRRGPCSSGPPRAGPRPGAGRRLRRRQHRRADRPRGRRRPRELSSAFPGRR